MEIGYNEATCRELSSLEKDLALAEAAGFTAFELRFDMIEKFLASHSYGEMESLFKRSRIRPVTINAIFNINFASPDYWKEMEAKVEFAGRIASVSGADILLALPSFDKGPPSQSRGKIFDDTVSALVKLAEMGEKNKLRIAFEPLGYKDSCVRSIKDSWEIIKRINRPDIGLALDAYNLYHYDRLNDVDDILEINPEKIFIVHINDAGDIPFEELGNYDRVLPGDGIIDCKKFIKTITDCGYDGVVSVEILNHDLWKAAPEQIIPEAYKKSREILFNACAKGINSL